MIGAIIGDIVGSRFEFNNNLNNYDFEFFTKECSITDDTVCTIAVAEAAMTDKDYKGHLIEWCTKPFEFKNGGYGSSFYKWLYSKYHLPYNSYGNGSAMRVSSIPWLFRGSEISEQAIASALPTHNHPEGIKGALVTALAIRGLTEEGKDVLSNLENAYYEPYKSYPKGYYDITCQGTVPVALRIVMKSHSFEDAIRNAVLWGGDTDTLAAIVGSMAEALWYVPEELKDGVMPYLTSDMKDVINDFNERRYD